MARTCIAARLTKPLIMGQTNTSAQMEMGSVWIPQLINVGVAACSSLLWLEGGMCNRKEFEEGAGTILGAEELSKSLCTSL